MDDLKRKARGLGLWNMFLPKNHFKDGPQFTNVEYGLMAEQLGKSITASEVWTFPFLGPFLLYFLWLWLVLVHGLVSLFHSCSFLPFQGLQLAGT
jgi:hypothetical protein